MTETIYAFKKDTSGRDELRAEMKRMERLLTQIGAVPLTERLEHLSLDRDTWVIKNIWHVNKVEVQGIIREPDEYRAQVNVYAENRIHPKRETKVLRPVRKMLEREGYTPLN